VTDSQDSSAFRNRVSVRTLCVGLAFAGLFAFLTVFFENRRNIIPTATQIPIMPYMLLCAGVLLINPLLRLVRFIRPFTVAELMIIFVMGMVSSGLSTFGLAPPLVGLTGSLYNEHWHKDSWNRNILPLLPDAYFVATPGVRDAAEAYTEAHNQLETLRAVYEAAGHLTLAERRLADAKAALQRDAEGDREAAGADLQRLRRRQALTVAEEGTAAAVARWRELSAGGAGAMPEVAAVLATHPDLIRRQEAVVTEREEHLTELKLEAFAKVDVFRRGLPEELRAYPGFLFTPRDDVITYFSRLKRFVYGRAALRRLRRAESILASAPAGGLSSDRQADAQGILRSTAATLSSIDNREQVQVRMREIETRTAELGVRYKAAFQERQDLMAQSDRALGADAKALKRRIRGIDRQQYSRRASRSGRRNWRFAWIDSVGSNGFWGA